MSRHEEDGSGWSHLVPTKPSRAEVAESKLDSLRDRLNHRLASLDEYGFTPETQVEDIEDDSRRAQAFGRWCELRFVLDLLNKPVERVDKAFEASVERNQELLKKLGGF